MTAPLPTNTPCFLCNQELDSDFKQSGQIAICGKCIKRFNVTIETWDAAFMEELRSVVFGYKTNYRCPQCWESIRFRSIYPRVLQCSATKQLVHRECGKLSPDGRFLSLNEYVLEQGEKAPDAPPQLRCKACHSPVDTKDDTRFNNQLLSCSSCETGLCLRCCRDSEIKDGRVINCTICPTPKSEGIISIVYKKLTGRS